MPTNISLDWVKLIGLLAPVGKFIYSKAQEYLSKEKNKNFEVKVNLVELQAPPITLLKTARAEEVKKQSINVKRWKKFGYFYLVMFCLQLIATYVSPNFQEMGFAIGFFLLTFLFARLTSAHWKRKEYLINLPLSPVGLTERHLVREMLLKEDMNFLIARSVTCLRKLGTKLYQATPVGSGNFEITAIKFKEQSWFKYSSYFDPPSEIGVIIAQKAGHECSVKLEVSLDKNMDEDMEIASEFIRLLLTEDRAQQVAEADRPQLVSHQS